MFSKITILIITSFLLIFISNCNAQTIIRARDSVIQKKLTHLNPVTYTFNIPSNVLRDKIIRLFRIESQMDNKTLEKIFYYNWPETGDVHKNQVIFFVETYSTNSFGSEYFEDPGTKNDIFLTQMADYWYSNIYYHKDKSFEFTSSYAIKLEPLNKISTRISIKSIGAEIFNGTFCCSPHGNGEISKTEKVEPTTVEEYTLILYIAQKLGVKGLPPLQLPK